MCRNIKTLFNFEPPATTDEIHAASLQYVRKISGSVKPSHLNEKVFDAAVKEVAKATEKLVRNLQTTAQAKNREQEAEKARKRALKRFS